MKTIEFKVDALPDDARLDKVIPFLEKSLSRGKTRELIEAGSVYLNKKRCKMNAKSIQMGDSIRIFINEKAEPDEIMLTPQDIIFENEDLIVVNKPPHLPTHETLDTSRHHLVLALQTFLAKRDNKKPAQIYLGVHHRLDRDTSGVILFTKRKEANAAVAQAFQDRTVEKTYLAICVGKPKQQAWSVKNFLGPSPRNKRFVASVQRGGKFAETDLRVLDEKKLNGQPVCLIEARPKTGRTHQIRVHLSEGGLPIVGDKAYGRESEHRVLLHAWKLQVLGHTFCAPLPRDFLDLDFKCP